MKLSLVLVLISAISSGHAVQFVKKNVNWTVGQTVQTSSGPVSGHASSNKTQVSEYLGIPFAKPPVGPLRFAAPQAYTGNSSLNGTIFGFSCPANIQASSAGGLSNIANANLTAAGLQILSALSQIGDRFSEDCLTLNVWTKPQVGEEKKAVLVWIYGGGFATGGSSSPAYTGQYIVDQQDVILVSINYRLNIFGFPGNPSERNNLGLLDQRLAIEWIYSNIASFGGDPSRITIFGQSAGGASVDYYSYAWTAQPLIAGIIPESGTVVGLGQVDAAVAAMRWYNVTSKLGCGDATSTNSTILTCMRSKNVSSILAALPSTGVAGSGSGFAPAIDEIVVFSDYIARSTAGKFIKVPMIVGNTDYEAGIFKVIATLANISYPEIFWTAFNLRSFNCPAATRANISISNKVPTWRYRWFGSFPNTALTTFPDSGAWHASELPLIFNTLPSGPGVPGNIVNETEIGDYIRGAWATFAKDPENGLKSYGAGGWPTYNVGQNTLARLAYMNYTGLNLAPAQLYDEPCAAIFPIMDNGTNSSSSTTMIVSPTTTATTTNTATGAATSTSASTSPTATKSAGAGNKAGWESLGALVVGAVGFAWLL